MPEMNSFKVINLVAIWFFLALLAGAFGVLSLLPPPAVVLILTGVVLLSYWKFTGLGDWLSTVNIYTLVIIHLTRFVGFYFLFLYSRGELPYQFAVLGGWGDIAIASTATMLAAYGFVSGRVNLPALLIWNVLGLIDILFVVVTAAFLLITAPDSMRALLTLPLSLLPTFLVPIVISTHIIMLARIISLRGK